MKTPGCFVLIPTFILVAYSHDWGTSETRLDLLTFIVGNKK